jgi:hypothetical protein
MERHEVMEATWISTACMSLLTLLIARAGGPTPQENIEIRLDAATTELAEDLVGRLVSATEDFRSEPVTGEGLQRQIENLGLIVRTPGGCVWVTPDEPPGCGVCPHVALA